MIIKDFYPLLKYVLGLFLQLSTICIFMHLPNLEVTSCNDNHKTPLLYVTDINTNLVGFAITFVIQIIEISKKLYYVSNRMLYICK